MKKIFFLLMAVFSLISSVSAIDIEIEGIDIVDSGIYTARPALGKIDFLVLDGVSLLKQTDSIPAVVGTMFGLRYTVRGKPVGKKVLITVEVLSPEITNAETGKKYFTERWSSEKIIGFTTFDGYQFEKDWELVSGKWTFQFFYKDRKFAEKDFFVYLPDEKNHGESLGNDEQDIQLQSLPDIKAEEEKNAFDLAVIEDTPFSYQLFLWEFPSSRYKIEIENRLKSLSIYKKALSENTLEAYRKYLSILPDGFHTDKVLEQIEALDFQFYSKVNTLWGYEYFLEKYPSSRFSKEAADKSENLKYKLVIFRDDISSYEHFLSEYSSSKYAEEITQRLVALKNDKSSFDEVVQKNTIKDYENFLDHHISSPFTAQAEKRLAQLRIEGIFSGKYKPLKAPVLFRGRRRVISALIFKNPLDRPVTFIMSGKEGFTRKLAPGEGGRFEFFSDEYKIAVIVESDPKIVWAGKYQYAGEYLFYLAPSLNEIRILEITPTVTNYSKAKLLYSEKAVEEYDKYMKRLIVKRKKTLSSIYPLKRTIPFRKLFSLSASSNGANRKLAHMGFMRLFNGHTSPDLPDSPYWFRDFFEFETLNMLGDKSLRGYTLGNIEVLGHKAVWPLIAVIKQTNETLHNQKKFQTSYSRTQNIQNSVIETIVKIQNGVADDIIASFKYADRNTRLALLRALAELSGPEHEDIFLKALEEREYTFKNVAAIGLMNIASEKSLSPLINVLYEVDDRFARKNALRALENISYERRSKLELSKEDFLKVLKAYDEWIKDHYGVFWQQRQHFFISNIPRDNIEDNVLDMIPTEDGIARQLLCEALSTAPLKKDLKLLERCLKDPDINAQKAALRGLAKLRDDRAVELIHEIIKTTDDKIINDFAIMSLGENNTRKAVKILKDLLKNHEPRKIFNALAETGSPAAAEFLANELYNRSNSYSARAAIGIMGKAAVPALQKALSNPDEHNRKLIISILWNIKDEEALTPLYFALKDKSSKVRKSAADAIYRHETVYMKKAVPDILISALKDDEVPNGEIIDFLKGKKVLQAGEAIEYVFLRDIEKGKVNYSAISALSDFNKRESLGKATPLLLEMLKIKDPRTDYRKYHALGKTGDEKAVEYLINMLEQQKKLNTVIYSLGKSRSRKAAGPLIRLLKKILRDPSGYSSKDPYSSPQRIIRGIVVALGDIKDPAAIPVLEEALKLKTKNPGLNSLYADLVRAIGKIRGPLSDMALVRELNRIREYSGNGFSSLSLSLKNVKNKDVIDLLTPVLKDGSLKAKREAVYILATIKTPEAINIFLDQYGKTLELDSIIRNELGRIGEPVLDPVIRLFLKQTEDEKINFIHVFGNIGSHKAIIHILRLYEERSERMMSGTKNAIKQSLVKILEASFPGLYIPDLSPSDVQRILSRSGTKEKDR